MEMMMSGAESTGRSGGDHVIPQNLDAEISVLGASMLTPNVIPGVCEIVRPHHFYRQSHQRIFEVIEDLFSRGEPVDPITVSEELANRASLDMVGGRAFVHSLVAAVPAATNARHYAEIVRENYYLRSLIKVGGEITEMGYRREKPPMDLIDQAEQMVFEISQTRVMGEFEPIGELISESFAELERTMTEGHHTVGCETGFRDLDALISGFQPSNLIVLAARPSMGKTAFALNIARNVGVDQNKGVAIFSLEMSKMEVVNRMMCSEARVDSWRVRRGILQPNEWSRLAAACTPLHAAPIFIDDSASLNLMEIRAKARRLKAKEKSLGLIVVDYLQLMMGDSSAESRQQEISRISRGLKILARELGVPVLALSQLSRQVEQRAGNRPVLSDLRECVTGDTLAVLADGHRAPVRDLVGRQPDLMAVTSAGCLTEARSDCVWSVGIRPIYELRTVAGHRLRATGQHRLLGARGWVTVGDLTPGDKVAVSRLLLASGRPEGSQAALSPRLKSFGDQCLGAEASSDLLLDEVTHVMPAGEEEVFDLTVPGPACWLADGLVSHNSGAIEQDADVVLFIYRDEVYNRDSPDKGTAEIIVGKQRNGPIGDCKLAFIQNFTRFADLADKRLTP